MAQEFMMSSQPRCHTMNMMGTLGQILIKADGTNDFNLEIKDSNDIYINGELYSSYVGSFMPPYDLNMILNRYPENVKDMVISCIEIYKFNGETFDAFNLGDTPGDTQIFATTKPYQEKYRDAESINQIDISLNQYKDFADGYKIFGAFKKITMQTGVNSFNPVPAGVMLILHFGWEL